MNGRLSASAFFRLGLKLIGVFILFTQALPSTISTVLVIAIVVIGNGYAPDDIYTVAFMLPIWWALGLYLFFGGRLLTNSNAVGLQRFCPNCSMDLVGTSGDYCTACGYILPKINHQVRHWASIKHAQEIQERASNEGRPLAEPWRSILEEYENRETK